MLLMEASALPGHRRLGMVLHRGGDHPAGIRHYWPGRGLAVLDVLANTAAKTTFGTMST